MVDKYVEGVHYYMEGERIVFTSVFHIERGQCCGNGCKHCPYEPKHKKGNVVVAKEKFKFRSEEHTSELQSH